MLGWQRWVETHSTPARHFIVMEKHKEAKRTVFENKDRNEKKNSCEKHQDSRLIHTCTKVQLSFVSLL